MVDDYIKIYEFKFDELKLESSTNDYEYEHLKFSDLSIKHVGKYQLEKGSILWKIDFKKKLKEPEKDRIKWQTEKLLKNFINQINDLKNFSTVPYFIEMITKITKIEESIKDFAEKVTKIKELEDLVLFLFYI